jgi:hypothetical protein
MPSSIPLFPECLTVLHAYVSCMLFVLYDSLSKIKCVLLANVYFMLVSAALLRHLHACVSCTTILSILHAPASFTPVQCVLYDCMYYMHVCPA